MTLKKDMQAEDLLLRWCAKVNTDRNVFEKIRQRLSPELNWAYFFARAKTEGVVSLVYSALSKIGHTRTIVPKHIWEEMESYYYLVAVRNTLLYQKLADILASFNKAGIEVMLLKGAALAANVYGNVALRPMADVDLLVKKENLSCVDATLKNIGYSSIDRSVEEIKPRLVSYLTTFDYQNSAQDSPSLHIHYHFVNSTIPTHSYIDKIKIEKIWQEAGQVEILGVKTLVMAPHQLLIHLAEHSLRVTHSFSRLSYFCDINEAINFYRKRLDWNRLVNQSFEFNLNRMVYFSLYFTAKFLNTAIPEEILYALKPPRFGWEEKIFVWLVARDKRFPGLSYLLHLAMNKGLLEKGRFILRTLFPPRQILAQRHYIQESKLNYFYYLDRIKEVFSYAYKGIHILSER